MLSREEEIELAELEALEAQATQEGVNPLQVLESASQGATLSLGDELGAGVNAGLDYMGFPGAGATGNESLGQAYDRRLEETRARQNQFATDHPAIDFGAKLVGGAPLGGGKNLLQQVAVQAGLGGAESFGASEDKFSEQGAIDTAIGAGTAGAFSGILGKMGRPKRQLKNPSMMTGRVSNEIADVAQRAEEVANRRLITRAAETQTAPTKAIEAMQETIPLASDAPRIRDNLRREINRAASESVGIPNPKGGSLANTLDEARSINNTAYNDVLDNTRVELPVDLNSDLANIILEDVEALGSSQDAKNIVKKAMSRIGSKTGFDGKMDGRELQKLRSEALAISRKAKLNTDPNSNQLEATVDKLVNKLDGAIYDGLPDDNARDAWRAANEQFKAIKLLETKGLIHKATGDVSPYKLYTALDKQAGNIGRLPEGNLTDLSILGTAPGTANSGTATRQMLTKGAGLLTGGAGAGAAGAAGAGLGVGPLLGLGGFIGGNRALSTISEHVPAGFLNYTGGSAARALEE